jgi:benzodiazapine receptor
MRIPIGKSTNYRGRNSRPHWLVLMAFILAALAVGAFGAIFSPGVSASAAHWYAALAKPQWAPPGSWFGPIWAVLYGLMGTSGWLIWRERYHRGRDLALVAYGLQLALNALWPPVFYWAKNIGAGLFLIVALWLATAWMIREFAQVKPAAAWASLPYLIWLSVAAGLNLGIWRLNP